jgi:hypothetical protein
MQDALSHFEPTIGNAKDILVLRALVMHISTWFARSITNANLPDASSMSVPHPFCSRQCR